MLLSRLGVSFGKGIFGLDRFGSGLLKIVFYGASVPRQPAEEC